MDFLSFQVDVLEDQYHFKSGNTNFVRTKANSNVLAVNLNSVKWPPACVAQPCLDSLVVYIEQLEEDQWSPILEGATTCMNLPIPISLSDYGECGW